jgi:Zn-dependent protease
MRVLRIVANVWGGHTSFEAPRTTPGPMAGVAAAGPAANAALALVSFIALQVTTGDVSGRVLTGLLIINGSLAALNILPGMPLDGGAVLESLVWKITGDRNKGSIAAGWCGRVLAVLLVLWFFLRPLASGGSIGFSSIWVIMVGSVLWTGATESIRRGQALSSLARVRVGSVMQPLTVLPASSTVQAAMDLPTVVVTLDERGVPCLVFLDNGHEMVPSAPLSAVVTRLPDENLVEASPDDDVTAVVTAMHATGISSVVLTAGGNAYGYVDGAAISEALSPN